MKNMKKLIGSCAAALMLASLSTPASAAYISDSWDDYVSLNTNVTDANLFGELGDNLGWTHNFTDNGFTPLVDLLTDGWIQIALRSSDGSVPDAEVRFGFLGLAGGGSFSSSTDMFNINIAGLLDLWATGSISANLEPRSGSFYAIGSLAHLDGFRYVDGDETVGVPEPGSLALLAIGLIGMGVALSRRRSLS